MITADDFPRHELTAVLWNSHLVHENPVPIISSFSSRTSKRRQEGLAVASIERDVVV